MPTAIDDTDEWVVAPDGPATGEPRTSALMRSYLGKINKRVRWTFNRLADKLFGEFEIIETGNAGADTIELTAHPYSNGDILRFESVGGSIPGGLFPTLAYYVVNKTADDFQVALSAGGPAVDITSAGTGDIYAFTVVDSLGAIMHTALTVGTYTIPIASSLRNAFLYVASTAGATFTGAVTMSGGLTLSGTDKVLYASRSLARVQTGLLVNSDTNVATSSLLTVVEGESATQNFDRLPNGSTLTGFTVYIDRNNTGVMPTTRVQVTLRKRAISTGTATVITGPTEDPEAVLANYEARHAITISGLSEVIDNTNYNYHLEVTGEIDPDGTSVLLYPAIATCTVTSQDEMP